MNSLKYYKTTLYLDLDTGHVYMFLKGIDLQYRYRYQAQKNKHETTDRLLIQGNFRVEIDVQNFWPLPMKILPSGRIKWHSGWRVVISCPDRHRRGEYNVKAIREVCIPSHAILSEIQRLRETCELTEYGEILMNSLSQTVENNLSDETP